MSMPPSQWNIFARELAGVMSARSLKLTHLYNRRIVYYPEIVRRLQQSLDRPAHFPILNPDELDRLVTTLALSHTEENRLKAAIVATSVERTLMDRINQEAALQAADDVFHIVFEAMEQQTDSALGHIKGGVLFVEPEIPDDRDFDSALDQIDRATLALHMSNNATTARARVMAANEAERAFSAALALLERSTPTPEAAAPSDEDDERERWIHLARIGREMAQSAMRPREDDDK